MNKKSFLAILLSGILCVLFLGVGCSQNKTAEAPVSSEPSQEPMVGMANPWIDSDAADIVKATGFSFKEPENAQEIHYSYMGKDNLAQMQFYINGARFTYRIQPATEFTDTSGCYYEWKEEQDVKVNYCDAKLYSFISKDETDVKLIMWYDVVPGVMYSLSVDGQDLTELDLQALAEELFEPLQGNN